MCHGVKSNVLASNLYFTMENKFYNHQKSSTFSNFIIKILVRIQFSEYESATHVLPQKQVLAS
jgi:hypothetical protein